MKLSVIRLLAFLCLVLVGSWTDAATLLPNGEQTFLGQNGNPLAGGSVQFYVPNTTTPKNTWKDSAQTILNTNPVILDGSGRATIYGSGVYRQIVKDSNGTVIWDQITSDTAASSFSWAGTSGGSADAQTVTASNFTNVDGQEVGFIASLNNDGPFTLTVNGGTPINVVKDTTSGPIALSGGEIVAQNQYTVIYDGALGEFHLIAYPITPGIGAPFPIASAATTDIGKVGTHNANITGSATITSFGSSASIAAPFYVMQFSGAATITASASISTPSGGNIVTSSGSSAVAIYQGSGVWSIISYYGSPIPTGMVAAFNSAGTCPPGWQVANGTNNTINARGVVIRGLALGDTRDPTSPVRTDGQYQADQIQSFTVSNNFPQGNSSGTGGGFGIVAVPPGVTTNLSFDINGANFGTETRVKSVAATYCEKL